MAVDMRLEKFAVDTYMKLWEEFEPDVPCPPRPKYYGDEKETDCTTEILALIRVRFYAFTHRLSIDLKDDYELYSRNGVDCYNYLRMHMTRYIAYSELHIFDKMLMSCAVAAKMGTYCVSYGNVLNKYTISFSWAMYFETEWKEEFYAAGGWTALKNYAETSLSTMLSWYETPDLKQLTQNDLELAEAICKVSEDYYFLNYIVKIFKSRYDGSNDCFSCSKCLPLFDVLSYISYGTKPKIDNFQLVEGYTQIFLRMINLREKYTMAKSLLENGIDEDLNLFATKWKAVCTKSLYDRIFVCENWNILKSRYNSKPCIFCGHDTRIPITLFERKDDSERIQDIKRIICETVSKVEAAETVESELEIEDVSRGVLSDEVEEKIALRLLFALGMKSALWKIKANIERDFNFKFQNRMHDVANFLKPTKMKTKDKRQKRVRFSVPR